MNDDLQKRIQAALANPQNMGEMAGADSIGTVGNADCGEMLRMWVKFKEQNGRKVIDRATFQSFGCETAIAVASLATELIRGKTAEEALALKTEELAGELGPLPPMKIHCAQLVEGALRSALEPEKVEVKPAVAANAPTLLDSFSKTKRRRRKTDFPGRREAVGHRIVSSLSSRSLPHFSQRCQCRLALGRLFAFSLSAPEFNALVQHGTFEFTVMIGTGCGNKPVLRGHRRAFLQQFLQFALWIFNACRFVQLVKISGKLPENKLPGGLKAII